MDVTLHDVGPDATAAWAALAGPLLAADPCRNTLVLTVLDEATATGDELALLLTVRDAGRVVGAALRSPGRGLLVSALPPDCAPAVVAALAGTPHEDLWRAGVAGRVEVAEAIAAVRVERSGERAVRQLQLRLWRLGALVAPPGVSGAPRPAGRRDVALLASWYGAFAAEAAPGRGPGDAASQAELCAGVERDLRLGRDLVVWEVEGRPVALAVAQCAVAGQVRIGPVYTPPEHRGRGYGSAVTAAAAARARAAGARHVVLFTDEAADVPNRIYARIGFSRIGEACEIRFERG